MNVQSIQIMDVTKGLFLEETYLILCTKKAVVLIGPVLTQVKLTQKECDFWPNINQSTLFFGICVCDCSCRLQMAWCEGIIPLAEKFREN